MRGAFIRWHESVTELRAMRSKTRLVVMRLKLKAVGDCMATWGEAVRQRRVARRCISKMTKRRLMVSFELFVAGIEGVARAEAEEARREASMAKVVCRMMMGALLAALRAWSDRASVFAAQRRLLHRFVVRLFQRVLLWAFKTWQSHAARASQLHHRLQLLLRSCAHSSARRARGLLR